MRILIAALLTVTTLAAGGARADGDHVAAYLALAGNAAVDDAGPADRFVAVFDDFDGGSLEARVREAYAERFHFNDTLVTLSDRDDLVKYLLDTAQRTTGLEMRVLDVAMSGDDVYVRWWLRFAFEVMGKARESESVGMTHLRFDNAGRIVLHQDFWDSAGGFYQAIPVVGRLISWVRSGLHP